MKPEHKEKLRIVMIKKKLTYKDIAEQKGCSSALIGHVVQGIRYNKELQRYICKLIRLPQKEVFPN